MSNKTTYTLPSAINFTDEQVAAIMEDGTNILVSAAAGCGKTTLLVERIIRKVLQNQVNLNQLVVVTFTEAAASELKQRLEVELTNRLNNDPSNEFLIYQLAILNDAYIMTFHSLCMRLLKENNLAFTFDNPLCIADTFTLNSIKKDVFNQFVDKYINEFDFKHLYDYYATPLNYDNLYQIINGSAELSINKADFDYFENGCENDLSRYHSIYDIDPFNELFKEANTYYITNLYQTLAGLKLSDQEHTKLQDACLAFEESLDEIRLAIEEQDYDKTYNLVNSLKLFRKPTKLSDQAKFLHDEIKKPYLLGLTSLYCYSSKEIIELYRHNQYTNKIILKYARLYYEALTIPKKKLGLLEFNDLEQYALGLLYDNGSYSKIALKLQRHFNEIMIDEYQDTNPIQEKIVSALSNGSNMFMVGDLKQSIYRFRNATSALFSNKYLLYSSPNNNQGKVINLSFNFRSKNEVLEMTNYIFKNVFSQQIGGIDYDDKAMLYFKNKALDKYSGDFKTEILLNKVSKEEDGKYKDDLPKDINVYTQMIIDNINKLINEGANYSDIAILHRTSTNIDLLCDALKAVHIPIMSHTSRGFYDVYEIKDLISMLKVIVNRYDDIALLSILRSYFFNLNENDFIILRNSINNNQCKTFYHALEINYPDIYNCINKIVNYSHSNNLLEVIDYIYEVTFYQDYYFNNDNYDQFLINIKAFKNLVNNNYDFYRSLEYFVEALEHNILSSHDPGISAVLSSNQDVVNIMTIHKSKGLEFKYIFIIDAKYRFKERGKHKLVHYQDKLLTEYFNNKEMITASNFFIDLVNFNDCKEIIAEELRVLYVALTRAKLKIFLVCNEKSESLYQYAYQSSFAYDYNLNENTVINFKNSNQAILTSLARHNNGLEIREDISINAKEHVYNYFGDLFKIRPYNITDQVDYTTISSTSNYLIKQVEPLNQSKNVISRFKPSLHQDKLLDFNNITDFDTFSSGNKIHKVFEGLDFNKILLPQIDYLIKKYDISQRYHKGIKSFCKTSLFSNLDNPKYYKEYEFTYLENGTLTTGIIDLLIIDNNHAYIIDYKSDSIDENTLVSNYTNQVLSYVSFIKKAYKLQTIGYLYSVYNQKLIEIEV